MAQETKADLITQATLTQEELLHAIDYKSVTDYGRRFYGRLAKAARDKALWTVKETILSMPYFREKDYILEMLVGIERPEGV